MGGDMISPGAIERALSGEYPAVGHPLSAGELGERLGPHRRGRYPGQAFTRAAISLYKLHPEQQSADFVEAFRSWVAAETLRQDQLRVRANGMTVDELLGEAGYVQQIGDDPVRALILVGQLPPGTLVSVNGHVDAVECTAEVVVCGCGQRFVRRSWNQRRCAACRVQARHGRQEGVKERTQG